MRDEPSSFAVERERKARVAAERRARLIALLRDGLSQSEAGRRMGIRRQVVWKLLRRAHELGEWNKD